MGLEHFFETVEALRPFEFAGPAHPWPFGVTFASLVDLEQRFRLQPPRFDEVIEAQRPVDDQYRVLDDDLAELLEGLLVETDLESAAAIVQYQGHAIRV